MTRRILFVDVAQCYGGAQRSLLETIGRMDDARVKPLLLGAHDAPDGFLYSASQSGIPFEKVDTQTWHRSWDGMVRAARDIVKVRPVLRELCQSEQIDLIYANGIQSGLLSAIAAPAGIPFLFHHRDIRCPQRALRFVVKRAARTLAVSEFVRRHIHAEIGRDDPSVTTLHNGIDLVAIGRRAQAMDFREQASLPPRQKLVVLIADFVEWKRHGLFIQAMAEVCRQRDDVVGYVVGGARDPAGFLLDELIHRQVEQLNLVERIMMTDSMPNPYPLLAAANVLVSVADGEPFGRTIVEALSLGVPVTLVRGGGPEEIVGDCPAATVVDPDPAAVAAGILASLDAPDHAQAARERAQLFSIDRHLDRLYTILDDIVPSAADG